MEKKYVKEIKDGKEVYSFLNDNGTLAREVETTEWELESYINYCLFPILNCIKRMGELVDPKERSEINEYADILNRLYDAASVQLEKMNDTIGKDLGIILIRATAEDCFGGFMQQDLIEAFVKKNHDTNRA
ncbi:MAG: hypothetical protein KKD92_12055 [Proteobacteria bacterium]|nr:hypothetical protein [Pseudomonadota bacterium]